MKDLMKNNENNKNVLVLIINYDETNNVEKYLRPVV